MDKTNSTKLLIVPKNKVIGGVRGHELLDEHNKTLSGVTD